MRGRWPILLEQEVDGKLLVDKHKEWDYTRLDVLLPSENNAQVR
jgi:hypothetical protein